MTKELDSMEPKRAGQEDSTAFQGRVTGQLAGASLVGLGDLARWGHAGLPIHHG